MNLQQELKVAKEVAQEAGGKVMEIYNTDYKVFDKNKKASGAGGRQSQASEKPDPLTEADLESEKVILPALKQFDYKILSEETKDNQTRLDAEKVWIIDPSDGTRDFLGKTGEFAIMIGLVFRGSPVLEVVYQPMTKKLYSAMQGQGAFLQRDGKKEKWNLQTNLLKVL